MSVEQSASMPRVVTLTIAMQKDALSTYPDEPNESESNHRKRAFTEYARGYLNQQTDMNEAGAEVKRIYSMGGEYDANAVRGDVAGLYGRMPVNLQKLVRKIADAPDYDHAAIELLDELNIEWRA